MKIRTHKCKGPYNRHNKELKTSMFTYGWGNGYIGVPKGHIWYGKHYDDISCNVHGGLTYSGKHEKFPYQNEELWWLGFDTAHYEDNEENCSEVFVDEQIELMKKQAEEAMK